MRAPKTNQRKRGRLIIIEGPDGVGKTTIAQTLSGRLREKGELAEVMSFPGNEPGTLGAHIYAVHHDPQRFGICSLLPASKQLLHVAAHLDSIAERILPLLLRGTSVILDRYWWSTWVYGKTEGVPANILDAMINLEKEAWGRTALTLAILVRRRAPIDRDVEMSEWRRLQEQYTDLAARERASSPILIVEDAESPDAACAAIESALQAPNPGPVLKPQQAILLDFDPEESPSGLAPLVLPHLAPVKATEVYNTYWRFAVERQEIFFRRLEGKSRPWTEDRILATYKFTNAYRASDRVSQFLIREVIYNPHYPDTAEEVFFRILLFKLFNKIETWRRFENAFGSVLFSEYSFDRYDQILTKAMAEKHTIYSAAYIMPSGGHLLGSSTKHRNHLRLLEHMMLDEAPKKIQDAKTMHQGFDLLVSYPMIGDFLAYQFITDLNYSELTDFAESDFVVPGPGALNGISKCFTDLGGLNEPELIRFITDQQETEFDRLGLSFRSLWGRRLQLIDCQNLFCEVDKYSRVRHPEVAGLSGRTRIKQKFSETSAAIEYWYPPKWGINEKIGSSEDRARQLAAKE